MSYLNCSRTDRIIDCRVIEPLPRPVVESVVEYVLETKVYCEVYLYNGLYVCGGVASDSLGNARTGVRARMEHYGLDLNSLLQIGIIVIKYQYTAHKDQKTGDFIRQDRNVENGKYLIMASDLRSDGVINALIDSGDYAEWSESGRGSRGCW